MCFCTAAESITVLTACPTDEPRVYGKLPVCTCVYVKSSTAYLCVGYNSESTAVQLPFDC